MWNQDIKPEINPVLNPRAAGPEGSLIGIPGILAEVLSLLLLILFIRLKYHSQIMACVPVIFFLLASYTKETLALNNCKSIV